MSHEIASADALMRANADLSRQIGELNTTIGYQDAMLAQLRAALNEALRLALVPEANQDKAWYAAFDRLADLSQRKEGDERS